MSFSVADRKERFAHRPVPFRSPKVVGFFSGGDKDKGSPPHRELLPTHPHKLMDRTGRGRCSIRSVAYAARAHVVTGHHRQNPIGRKILLIPQTDGQMRQGRQR